MGRDDCFDLQSRDAYSFKRYFGRESGRALGAEATFVRLIQSVNKGVEVGHHGSIGFKPIARRDSRYSDFVIAI